MSPAADASAVGGPPAARTRTNDNRAAIEAIAATAAPTSAVAAPITAAPASASAAPLSLRRRGRRADQNGRGAGHVDEQQSQRCEAAGQDIVAFSHSGISGSLPRHLDFGTISLRRARQLSVQMR